MVKFISGSILMMLLGRAVALPQVSDNQPADGDSGAQPKPIQFVFDYLKMAGSKTAADFKPLSQRKQNAIFLKSFINPVWYLKGATSAALDLKDHKPSGWELGASGYGKRFASIMGQYVIQRTTTFGLGSVLHEDNRYFGSGKKGFWRRTSYAVSSSVLARHDNGKQYPSISLVSGYAAGAFLSRLWQPPDERSAGDGAVSFGISMGFNVLSCEVKEFLPDIVRPIIKRYHK